MFIKSRLPQSKVEILREYIVTNLAPLAEKEKAKCALGRLNLWLEAEPVYRLKKYKLAHHDDRLWSFIKRIDPEAAVAQLYFGTGGIGIDWHRDAAYSEPAAHILNLGKVTLESKDNSGKVTSLQLVGGEIVSFNCKLMHRAIAVDDSRIGIGIWQAAIPLVPENFV